MLLPTVALSTLALQSSQPLALALRALLPVALRLLAVLPGRTPLARTLSVPTLSDLTHSDPTPLVLTLSVAVLLLPALTRGRLPLALLSGLLGRLTRPRPPRLRSCNRDDVLFCFVFFSLLAC